MIPHHFHGQSRVLEAPEGWDHKEQGECVGLPVRYERETDGRVWGCTSAWKPTAEELAALNAGGAVLVTCVGGQPPMMIGACEADCLLVSA